MLMRRMSLGMRSSALLMRATLLVLSLKIGASRMLKLSLKERVLGQSYRIYVYYHEHDEMLNKRQCLCVVFLPFGCDASWATVARNSDFPLWARSALGYALCLSTSISFIANIRNHRIIILSASSEPVFRNLIKLNKLIIASVSN